MPTYAVQLPTADLAVFLADREGNDFYLAADGTVLKFDDVTRAWFDARPEDDDGHIDAGGTMWVGGYPYPVRTLAD